MFGSVTNDPRRRDYRFIIMVTPLGTSFANHGQSLLEWNAGNSIMTVDSN